MPPLLSPPRIDPVMSDPIPAPLGYDYFADASGARSLAHSSEVTLRFQTQSRSPERRTPPIRPEPAGALVGGRCGPARPGRRGGNAAGGTPPRRRPPGCPSPAWRRWGAGRSWCWVAPPAGVPSGGLGVRAQPPVSSSAWPTASMPTARRAWSPPVSYTNLRAHQTVLDFVFRLLL